MAAYGKASEERLQTAHPKLQEVFRKALELGIDHSILCGWRSGEDQHKAFVDGFSKLDYPPGGEHNKKPSMAVDSQPYPAHEDKKRWAQNQILFAGQILGIAKMLGIKLRWGGDWDMDLDTTDENGLIDFPHFELED